MPEIAEVARITHFLRRHLVGKRIRKAAAIDDNNVFGKVGTTGAAVQKALTGKKVVGAGSQGKYFWILLDSAPHLVMHFGMTGWVHIKGEQTAYTRYYEKSKGQKEEWPPKFWKFHITTEGDPAVDVAFTDARRFGRVRLVDCPGDEIRKHTPLVENGPDPVVDKEIFTEDYLKKIMRKRHVPIKALLLDQTVVSGIGNWVGDEIMYQAKLHPEQYSDDFDDHDITTLFKAICYVCDTAVEKLGDSDEFPDDWLFHHRWGKGKKDAASTLPSGEKLTFITVGGRTSCVVPSVQKKRGRAVPPGIKEESIPPDDGTKSAFFEEKSVEQVAGEAEAEDRPRKRQKKTAKSVKAEKEDKVSKAVKAEKDEKQALSTGRRRSGRLVGRG
ncbi:hypothetical protein GQ53DRAFT_755270 [Thozetella sp. PMI_491]|nr:hypothetical protein GQ53DRAFT_755270 [Thozetella sp. PMI_491]